LSNTVDTKAKQSKANEAKLRFSSFLTLLLGICVYIFYVVYFTAM